MSNEELTPVEEQALDALLDEMLGKAGPPDLSREILMRLHQTPAEVGPIVSKQEPRARSGSQARSKTPVLTAVAVLAALAAIFAAAIALQPDHETPDSVIAESDLLTEPLNIQVADAATNRPERVDDSNNSMSQDRNQRKPPRGIPMIVESPRKSDPRVATEDVTPAPSSKSPASIDAVSLVSNQVDSELRGYWDAIGIQPAAEATGKDVASRLESMLGIKVSEEAIFDADRLQAELSRRQVARAIAIRWLEQISEGGIQRIDADARNGLVNELTANFQSKRKFDKTLSAWIDGTSQQAPAFYAAVAAGPRHANGNGAMARRLAALTMNVDLRCTRCHDSLIKGNDTQQDHWGFEAFLKRGVTRSDAGELKIDAVAKQPKPLFYDLPDGRRSVAEPAVASSWMKTPDLEPIEQVSQWSSQMVGSPELARGVVNSLWQLVHGQPLQGRIVDPISAPHNEALDRLEQKLTQDLLDSQFDIARTLALIIASPATRRAVPSPLKPENVWASKEADTRSAMNAVDAFAASLPPGMDLSINQRIDESLRAIGAKIDLDGRPFVAQVGSATDKGTAESPENSLSADFPARASSLPVQWLKLIEDEQSQIDHLGYLAGMSELPANVNSAVDAMQTAEVDSNLMLHRVWWLVKPQ
ncbi:MAG: hypothetical protein ACR2NZ_02385 [Rubripirellula sp.]